MYCINNFALQKLSTTRGIKSLHCSTKYREIFCVNPFTLLSFMNDSLWQFSVDREKSKSYEKFYAPTKQLTVGYIQGHQKNMSKTIFASHHPTVRLKITLFFVLTLSNFKTICRFSSLNSFLIFRKKKSVKARNGLVASKLRQPSLPCIHS